VIPGPVGDAREFEIKDLKFAGAANPSTIRVRLTQHLKLIKVL